MVAADTGNHKILKTLIDAEAKIESTDNDGHTALVNAVRGRHAKLVRLLLDQGADPLAVAAWARGALNAGSGSEGEAAPYPCSLGWRFYERGLYKRAISQLEECVQRAPDNPAHHFHLGMAYIVKGRDHLSPGVEGS